MSKNSQIVVQATSTDSKSRKNFRRKAWRLASAVAGIGMCLSVSAQADNWTAGNYLNHQNNTSNWIDALNWSGGVPGAADDAIFNPATFDPNARFVFSSYNVFLPDNAFPATPPLFSTIKSLQFTMGATPAAFGIALNANQPYTLTLGGTGNAFVNQWGASDNNGVVLQQNLAINISTGDFLNSGRLSAYGPVTFSNSSGLGSLVNDKYGSATFGGLVTFTNGGTITNTGDTATAPNGGIVSFYDVTFGNGLATITNNAGDGKLSVSNILTLGAGGTIENKSTAVDPSSGISISKLVIPATASVFPTLKGPIALDTLENNADPLLYTMAVGGTAVLTRNQLTVQGSGNTALNVPLSNTIGSNTYTLGTLFKSGTGKLTLGQDYTVAGNPTAGLSVYLNAGELSIPSLTRLGPSGSGRALQSMGNDGPAILTVTGAGGNESMFLAQIGSSPASTAIFNIVDNSKTITLVGLTGAGANVSSGPAGMGAVSTLDAVVKTGAGTLVLSDPLADKILAPANNTFMGNIRLDSGVVVAPAPKSLGNGYNTNVFNGGTLRLLDYVDPTSGNHYGFDPGNAGSAVQGSAPDHLAVAGVTDNSGNRKFEVRTSGALDIQAAYLWVNDAGQLWGPGTLTVKNTGLLATGGRLLLDADYSITNTTPTNSATGTIPFTGNIIIDSGGLVRLGNANGAGTAGSITVNPGGVLVSAATGTVMNTINLAGGKLGSSQRDGIFGGTVNISTPTSFDSSDADTAQYLGNATVADRTTALIGAVNDGGNAITITSTTGLDNVTKGLAIVNPTGVLTGSYAIQANGVLGNAYYGTTPVIPVGNIHMATGSTTSGPIYGILTDSNVTLTGAQLPTLPGSGNFGYLVQQITAATAPTVNIPMQTLAAGQRLTASSGTGGILVPTNGANSLTLNGDAALNVVGATMRIEQPMSPAIPTGQVEIMGNATGNVLLTGTPTDYSFRNLKLTGGTLRVDVGHTLNATGIARGLTFNGGDIALVGGGSEGATLQIDSSDTVQALAGTTSTISTTAAAPAGRVLFTSGTPTINVATGATLNIPASITDGGSNYGINKTGGGLLKLSAPNTLGGQLAINGGVVQIDQTIAAIGTGLGANKTILLGGSDGGGIKITGTTVYAAGLKEGRIQNTIQMDFTTANPGNFPNRLSPRMAERFDAVPGGGAADTSGNTTWGNNETWVYTGQFFDANGIFAMASYIDDRTWISIDGKVAMANIDPNSLWTYTTSTATTDGRNNDAGGTIRANTNTGANVNPTSNWGMGPNGDGWHNIEIRVQNGTGGAGSGAGNTVANGWTTTYGLGISLDAPVDPLNGASYFNPMDPGNASLFRTTAGLSGLDLSGHDLDAKGASTSVDLSGTLTGQVTKVGNVALYTGNSFTVYGAGTTLQASSTSLNGSNGTITIASAGADPRGDANFITGAITDGTNTGILLNINTAGSLTFDNTSLVTPNDLNGTTINVFQNGRIAGIGAAGGSDPLAGLTVNVQGDAGSLRLSSSSGNVGFNATMMLNANGRLEHVGTTSDTLGTGGTVAFMNGNTLTLDVATGGALTVNGTLDGTASAGLIKNGGGTATLGGTAANTFGGLTTNNAGTLQLGKPDNTKAIGAVNIVGGSVQLLANQQIFGGVTLSGGTLDTNSKTQFVPIVAANSGAAIDTGGAGTLYTPVLGKTVDGVATLSGRLVAAQDATLVPLAAPTTWTVSAGSLRITNAAAVGAENKLQNVIFDVSNASISGRGGSSTVVNSLAGSTIRLGNNAVLVGGAVVPGAQGYMGQMWGTGASAANGSSIGYNDTPFGLNASLNGTSGNGAPGFTVATITTPVNFPQSAAADGQFLGVFPGSTGTDFTAIFSGYFLAPKTGTYSFGVTGTDDFNTFWIDKNQNGTFDAGEQVAALACCNGTNTGTVDLSAGQFYKFAMGVGDTGGQSGGVFRWSDPGGTLAVIDPLGNAANHFFSSIGALGGKQDYTGSGTAANAVNVVATAVASFNLPTGPALYNSLTLSDGATIHVNTSNAPAGTVWNAGFLSTTLPTTGGTFTVGGGTTPLDNGGFAPGLLDDSKITSGTVTWNIATPGNMVLDNVGPTPNNLSKTTINVGLGGILTLLPSGQPGSFDPLGATPATKLVGLNLGQGSTLRIANKDGDTGLPATTGMNVVIGASATIEHTGATSDTFDGGAGSTIGINNSSQLTLLATGGTLTINNTLTESGGSGQLIMNGPGTMILGGATANSFSGLTTVNNGTLALNKPNNTQAIGSVLINGGTVKNLANQQINGDITLNGVNATFDTNSKTQFTPHLYAYTGQTIDTGNAGTLYTPVVVKDQGNTATIGGRLVAATDNKGTQVAPGTQWNLTTGKLIYTNTGAVATANDLTNVTVAVNSGAILQGYGATVAANRGSLNNGTVLLNGGTFQVGSATLGLAATLYSGTGYGVNGTDAQIASLVGGSAGPVLATAKPFLGAVSMLSDAAFGTAFNNPAGGPQTGANFSTVWQGYFLAPVNGVYQFGMPNHDDSAAIWMDLNRDGTFQTANGEMIMNAGGCCGPNGPNLVTLAAGAYRIAFTQEDTGGGSSLHVQWANPGGTIADIDTSLDGSQFFATPLLNQYMTTTNVVVPAGNSGTLVANGLNNYLGTLTIAPSSSANLTVQGIKGQAINFAQTIFDNTASGSNITFASNAAIGLGQITDGTPQGGGLWTLSNTGTGTIVFNNTLSANDLSHTDLILSQANTAAEVDGASTGFDPLGNIHSIQLNAANTTLFIGSNGSGNATVNGNVIINPGSGSFANISHNGTTSDLFSGTKIDIQSGGLSLSGDAGSLTLSHQITGVGTGGIIKTGAGTVVLNGTVANDFQGPTVVNAGTLVLQKPDGIRAIGSPIIDGAGAVVRLGNNEQIVDVGGRSVTVKNGGTFDLGGKTQTLENNTTTNSVALTLGDTGNVISSVGTTGKLNMAGDISYVGTNLTASISSGKLDLMGGTRTIAVNDSPAVTDLAIGATLTNGGILKTGNGRIEFSGSGGDIKGDVQITAGSIALIGTTPLGSSKVIMSPNTTMVLGKTTYTPGLTEGRLAGAFDVASPNPGGATVLTPLRGESNNNSGVNVGPGGTGVWNSAGNETWIYNGQIHSASGVFAFAESIDDSVQIKVDGVVVLNNQTWNQTTSTASATGNAAPNAPFSSFGMGPNGDGWHDIEIRFGNGGGGAGAVAQDGFSATYGFGFIEGTPGNPLNGGSYGIPTDPGNGTLFRIVGSQSPFFGASNAVDAKGDGITIDMTNQPIGSVSTMGALTRHAATTLTVLGGARSVAFASTTLTDGADWTGSNYNFIDFTGTGNLRLGALSDGPRTDSAAPRYVIREIANPVAGAPTGQIVLNNTSTKNDLDHTIIEIQAGGLGAVGSGLPGAFDPMGGADIRFTGDNTKLALSSATTTGTAIFSSNVAFSLNGIIEHTGITTDQLGATPPATPNTITMTDGKTLTLSAIAGTLKIDSTIVASGTQTIGVGVTKTGPATMVLEGTGSNTFTGPITNQAGTLILNKTGGATAGKDLIVNGGLVQYGAGAGPQLLNSGSITLNQGTVDLNGNSQTLANLVPGVTGTSSIINGSINLASTTLTKAGSPGSITTIGSQLTLPANSTVNVTGGTLRITNGNNNIGAGTVFNVNGGALGVQTQAGASSAIGATSPVNLTNGTLALSGGGTYIPGGLKGQYYFFQSFNAHLYQGGNQGNFAWDYRDAAGVDASFTMAPFATVQASVVNFPDVGVVGFSENPAAPVNVGRYADNAGRFTGKVMLPTTGLFTFSTNSDDASMLFIDGKQVVFNDQNQGNTERTGQVFINTPGLHDISAYYNNGSGGANMAISYQFPNIGVPGTTGNGSNIITVQNTKDITVGQSITGNNIPAGSVVTAVLSSTQFTINNNATAGVAVAISGPAGSTTSGSNIVTVPDTTYMLIGEPITGNGIPNGSTVGAIIDGTHVAIVNPASRVAVVTTSGSTTVTTTSTTGFVVGGPVSGPGIPAGATVASITNGTTFVISAAATATGAGVYVDLPGNNNATVTGSTPVALTNQRREVIPTSALYTDGAAITNPVVATGNSTINVANTGSIGSLTVGGQLTVTGGALVQTTPITLSGDTVLYNNSTVQLAGVNQLATSKLTKDGAGTLVLTAPSTYTGGTVVNNGALRIAAASAMPAASSLTLKNGGALEIFTDTNSPNVDLGGLTVPYGARVTLFRAQSTLAGTAPAPAVVPTAPIQGTFEFATGADTPIGTYDGLKFAPNSTLLVSTLTNARTLNNTVQVNADTVSPTANQTTTVITRSGNASFGAQQVNLNGVISGAGGVAFMLPSGSEVRLQATETYTGPTYIENSTVRLGTLAGILTNPTPVINLYGGTFEINDTLGGANVAGSNVNRISDSGSVINVVGGNFNYQVVGNASPRSLEVVDRVVVGGGGVSVNNGGGNTSAIAGTTAVGSAAITATTTTNIRVGDTVTGTGIPAGSIVTSVDSGTQYTINQAATAAGTNNMTVSTNVGALVINNLDLATIGGQLNFSGIGATLNNNRIQIKKINGVPVVLPTGTNTTLIEDAVRVNNADFAALDAAGDVVALTGTTALTLATPPNSATTNYKSAATSGTMTLTANAAANTINLTTNGAVTIALGANNFDIAHGGLLITGNNNVTFTGTGTITASNDNRMQIASIDTATLDFQQPFTVTTMAMTIATSGTVRLSNIGNSLSGGITLSGGTLLAQAAGNPNTAGVSNKTLGTATNPITLITGTLNVQDNGPAASNVTIPYGNPINVKANSTINVDRPSANGTNTVAFGPLSMDSARILTLTSGNNYAPSFASLNLVNDGTINITAPRGFIAGAMTAPADSYFTKEGTGQLRLGTLWTTTSGSTTVAASNTSNLAVGQAVSGTGIPAGATIATIVNNSSFTISSAATASGTISFSGNSAATFLGSVQILAGSLQLDIPDYFSSTTPILVGTTPAIAGFNPVAVAQGNNQLQFTDAGGTLGLGVKNMPIPAGTVFLPGGGLRLAADQNLASGSTLPSTPIGILEVGANISNTYNGIQIAPNNPLTGMGILRGPNAFDGGVTYASNLTILGPTEAFIPSNQLTVSGIISGAGKLTKTGGNTLVLSGNNTFSGGIDLSAGTLTATGTGALGGGITTVYNNTTLNLNATKVTNNDISIVQGTVNYNTTGAMNGRNLIATSTTDNTLTGDGAGNPGTAQNGIQGLIFLNNTLPPFGDGYAGDQFVVNAGAVIEGNTAHLNALDRGFDGSSGLPRNVTLATGAIIAHTDNIVSSILEVGAKTDLFFGLGGNLNVGVTIGANTPWQGISTDRSARTFQSGNILVDDGSLNGTQAPTVTSITLKSINTNGGGGLTIGNAVNTTTVASTGTVTTNIKKISSGSGQVDANVYGRVSLDGGTAAGPTADYSGIRNFIVDGNNGLNPAYLIPIRDNAMGGASGSAIPGIIVRNGGTLDPAGITATNAAQATGRFFNGTHVTLANASLTWINDTFQFANGVQNAGYDPVANTGTPVFTLQTGAAINLAGDAKTFLAAPVVTNVVNATGGTTTNANNTVTVADTTGMAVGQFVAGSGIPGGAFITAVNSGTQITISANATASASNLAIKVYNASPAMAPQFNSFINAQPGVVWRINASDFRYFTSTARPDGIIEIYNGDRSFNSEGVNAAFGAADFDLDADPNLGQHFVNLPLGTNGIRLGASAGGVGGILTNDGSGRTLNANTTITGINGNTTSGSNIVTIAGNVRLTGSDFVVGRPISGTNIPAGTYITAISDTQLTLSQNATGTVSATGLTINYSPKTTVTGPITIAASSLAFNSTTLINNVPVQAINQQTFNDNMVISSGTVSIDGTRGPDGRLNRAFTGTQWPVTINQAPGVFIDGFQKQGNVGLFGGNGQQGNGLANNGYNGIVGFNGFTGYNVAGSDFSSYNVMGPVTVQSGRLTFSNGEDDHWAINGALTLKGNAGNFGVYVVADGGWNGSRNDLRDGTFANEMVIEQALIPGITGVGSNPVTWGTTLQHQVDAQVVHANLALVQTGTTVLGSNQITVASTANYLLGENVRGVGIPDGSVITSIDSATQFTINNAATAAGAGVTINLLASGGEIWRTPIRFTNTGGALGLATLFVNETDTDGRNTFNSVTLDNGVAANIQTGALGATNTTSGTYPNQIFTAPGGFGGSDVRLNTILTGATATMRRTSDFSFVNIKSTVAGGASTLTLGDPADNGTLSTSIMGTVDAGMTLNLVRADVRFDQFSGKSLLSGGTPSGTIGGFNVNLRSFAAFNSSQLIAVGVDDIVNGGHNIVNFTPALQVVADANPTTVDLNLQAADEVDTGANLGLNGGVVKFNDVRVPDTGRIQLSQAGNNAMTVANLTLQGATASVFNNSTAGRSFIGDVTTVNPAVLSVVTDNNGGRRTKLVGTLNGPVDIAVTGAGIFTIDGPDAALNLNIGTGNLNGRTVTASATGVVEVNVPTSGTVAMATDSGEARVYAGKTGVSANMLTSALAINMEAPVNAATSRQLRGYVQDSATGTYPVYTNNIDALVTVKAFDTDLNTVDTTINSNRDGADLAINSTVNFTNVHLANNATVRPDENDGQDIRISVVLDGALGGFKHEYNRDAGVQGNGQRLGNVTGAAGSELQILGGATQDMTMDGAVTTTNIAVKKTAGSVALRPGFTINSTMDIQSSQVDLMAGTTPGATGTFKLTGGTLNLNADAGNTVISNNGTLNLGAAQNLISLTVNNTTTALSMNGFNLSTASLNGAGTAGINNGGALATLAVTDGKGQIYSGPISGNIAFVKDGLGSLTLAGSNSHTGGTTVNAGTLITQNLNALGGPAASATVGTAGTLQIDAPGAHLGNLTVNGTAKVTAGNVVLGTVDGSGNTVTAGTLSLGAAGVLDLNDRELVIHYNPAGVNPAVMIKNALAAGRNVAPGGVADGTWDGLTGIRSTTAAQAYVAAGGTEFLALGYGDTANMPFNDAPDMQGLASTVFVKYTRVGDASMDGIVGDTDVTVLGALYDPSYDPTGPGGPKHWYEGDFNYNGIVDDSDVTLLGANYDPTQPPMFASLSSQYGSAFAAAFIKGYDSTHSGTATVVPEPGALTLLGLGALGLIRRRRQA